MDHAWERVAEPRSGEGILKAIREAARARGLRALQSHDPVRGY